jgi:hypothetical protein
MGILTTDVLDNLVDELGNPLTDEVTSGSISPVLMLRLRLLLGR